MADVLSKVVLVGASGTVGSCILASLLEDPQQTFTITVLSRPDSPSTHPSHPNITVVKTEYNLPNLTSIFTGHDVVIHAGAIASLSMQPLMIEAAVAAGVRRFILNEFVNSPVTQMGLPELEPFRTTKREVLNLARLTASENPGFSWSALATGHFLDYGLRKYPQFGIDIAKRRARLVDDGTERITAVTLRDVGVATRGILRRPEETKNRFCHVRSVETCQKEILEALEAEMTGEKWEVEYVDSQAMYDRGKEAWSRGERSGQIDLLVVQLFAKGGHRSVVVGREESDNALLGVEEKDIMEIVRDVLKSF